MVISRSMDERMAAIEAGDEPPLYAEMWHLLLQQAEVAVERRLQAYPEMVAKGRIDETLAATDITGWQLLVQEWRWIITGEGEPPARITLPDRITAVDLAWARVRNEINNGNTSYDILRQSHLIRALRWHLDQIRFGNPAIHFIASCNHEWRRRQAEAETGEPSITERAAA